MFENIVAEFENNVAEFDDEIVNDGTSSGCPDDTDEDDNRE